MKRYNAEGIYRLGKALQPLASIGEGDSCSSHLHEFLEAIGFIKSTLLVEGLELSEGTRTSALSLQSLLSHSMETVFELAEQNKNYREHKLGTVATEIIFQVKEFETRFYGDCVDLNLFFIPPVAAYDTNRLLDRGHSILGNPWDLEVEQYPDVYTDVLLASRCLALQLWTASAFHISRATEGLVQAYYEKLEGPLPERGMQRTWGALVADLKVKGKGDKALLERLDFVVKNYRNPFIHPEHSLDETDAPQFLSACVGAMTKLLSELKPPKAQRTP